MLAKHLNEWVFCGEPLVQDELDTQHGNDEERKPSEAKLDISGKSIESKAFDGTES